MIRATAILGLVLALTLTAAAHAKPKAKPAEPSILVPAGPPPAPPPPPPPPAPTVRELTAANEAQVRARLGAPDVARREGAGAFWTYRFKSCALFVYFRAEDGQPLKVTGAAAGPRRRGQSTPKVEACLAQYRDRGEVAAADDPIQAILDLPGGDQQP